MSEDEIPAWRDVVRQHMPDFQHLLPPGDRPLEFLDSMLALAASMSAESAAQLELPVRWLMVPLVVRRGARGKFSKLQAILASRVDLKDAGRSNTDFSDKKSAEFLTRPDCREALAWLREKVGQRTLGEYASRASSVRLVNRFYAAGAISVFAVEIDEYPDGENSGRLVVELPGTSAARRAVLDVVAKVSRARGWETDAPDGGQRYEFLMLD